MLSLSRNTCSMYFATQPRDAQANIGSVSDSVRAFVDRRCKGGTYLAHVARVPVPTFVSSYSATPSLGCCRRRRHRRKRIRRQHHRAVASWSGPVDSETCLTAEAPICRSDACRTSCHRSAALCCPYLGLCRTNPRDRESQNVSREPAGFVNALWHLDLPWRDGGCTLLSGRYSRAIARNPAGGGAFR